MFVLTFDAEAFDAIMVPEGREVSMIGALTALAALEAGQVALDSAYESWVAAGDVNPARLFVVEDGSVFDLGSLDENGDAMLVGTLTET